MLKLRQLTLYRGSKSLLEQVSLGFNPGQKIGLIGANGSGKSSFFALIQGELQADHGHLDLPTHWQVAHVAQETPALAQAALDYVIDGDTELRQIEAALHTAEQDNNATKIAHLHEQLATIEGYAATARASRLLAGLGFKQTELHRPVAEFSGGWRVRLNLAKALMCRSDLLLLDEPTNHLDLDAVIWLEQWLNAYPGTLLLISHDREFIDSVVDSIAHLEQRNLTLYSGNYSAFEEQRSERLALQQARFDRQQRQREHLQQFIDRFRAKATKARQAQSRLKTLQKMEALTPAHSDSPFEFTIPAAEKFPNPLLALKKAAIGYEEQTVLQNISFSLQPGSRWGLLGPNGAGKSTLIKTLADLLQLTAGERLEGQGLSIGYFAQHQLEQLRPEHSPLQHIQALSSRATEQSIRNFLGGFGFVAEQALDPVAPFSGGEKARLALAMLVWLRPNLLLLDEPTNHLDIEMRRALSLALQNYQGALVLVSHDRHLLRSCCDEFLLVHGGKVQPFAGDLEDYRRWLEQQNKQTVNAANNSGQAQARQAQKRQQAEQRNQLAKQRRPLEKQVQKLEQSIQKLEQKLSELDDILASPELYEQRNKDKLTTLLQDQGERRLHLAELEHDWLELQEVLEILQP